MKELDKNQYTAYGNQNTKLSVVAFLDILGYREFLMKKNPSCPDGSDDPSLNDKLALLKQCIENSYIHARDALSVEIDSQRFWETKTFSDNISIFYPVRNEQISAVGYHSCSDQKILAIFHVASLMAYLQMEMIRSGGFFVRGGIAIGQAYVDENFIFSDALIEAYKSETEDAIDPRIVFSKSAAECIDKYIQNDKNGDVFDFLCGISKDVDGLYYVDYLNHLEDETEFSKETFLNSHKETLVKKLSEVKDNPKCLRKYLWSVNYHNRFCNSLNLTDKMILQPTEASPGEKTLRS